jgi:hypothetical protein
MLFERSEDQPEDLTPSKVAGTEDDEESAAAI